MSPVANRLFALAVLASSALAYQYSYEDESFQDLSGRDAYDIDEDWLAARSFDEIEEDNLFPRQDGNTPTAPAAHVAHAAGMFAATNANLPAYDRARIALSRWGRSRNKQYAAQQHSEYDADRTGQTWGQRQQTKDHYQMDHGTNPLNVLSEERKNRIAGEWNNRNDQTVKQAQGKHDLWVQKTDKLNTGMTGVRTGAAVVGAAGGLRPRDFEDDFDGDYMLLSERDLPYYYGYEFDLE